ncbi:MAG: hypothetical protein SGILL_004092 [Bacillariaceae sp.]
MTSLRATYPDYQEQIQEGDLGENILVDGVNFQFFKVGSHYCIDSSSSARDVSVDGAKEQTELLTSSSKVVLEITERVQPCANLCKLPYINDDALAPKERIQRCQDFVLHLDRWEGYRGWYAKVISGGVVRKGATITEMVHHAHSQQQPDNCRASSIFPAHGKRPLFAIITETNACDSVERMEATFDAIQQATLTEQVDLVSVRLNVSNGNGSDDAGVLERACILTRRLVDLAHTSEDAPSFKVVCSSDLVSVAVKGRAHGVHVKEHHLGQLPGIVAQFNYPILIGTSAHSLQSLPQAGEHDLQPDYYFVGTCYLTASHPEKSASELEGPTLPGQFQRELAEIGHSIPVFAIGGIDDANCHEPVFLGADGVAVIRAVLQAERPAEVVARLQENMMKAKPH